jgi:hypothetical protein
LVAAAAREVHATAKEIRRSGLSLRQRKFELVAMRRKGLRGLAVTDANDGIKSLYVGRLCRTDESARTYLLARCPCRNANQGRRARLRLRVGVFMYAARFSFGGALASGRY